MIKTDISGITSFIDETVFNEKYLTNAEKAYKILVSRSGAGAEYTGWLDLPDSLNAMELTHIRAAAQNIRDNSDALVVIGIGGSYLGARAAVDALCSPEHNLLHRGTPAVFFAGNTMSGTYMARLLDMLKDRDFSVNVVSKSGTTTEPAVAFRFFRELMEKKYGAAAGERIYATTDARRGALKGMADEKGWNTFSVPDNVGGRYSVMTPVGLLPMAVAGIDIDAALCGVRDGLALKADALLYAAARQYFCDMGKKLELMAVWDPSMRFFGEWWKQLFGESEGKSGKNLFPASAEFTADLHSMGQYVQDGQRTLIETMLISDGDSGLTVPADARNEDGLNYLAGRDMAYINRAAADATKCAHISGGVPVIELRTGVIDAHAFGELTAFFELACGISAYMSGINPFDQPGVEEYKRNMFERLGKPKG